MTPSHVLLVGVGFALVFLGVALVAASMFADKEVLNSLSDRLMGFCPLGIGLALLAVGLTLIVGVS